MRSYQVGAIFDWETASVWHTYKITQEEEESTVYWIFPLVSNELFRDRLSSLPPLNFIDSLSLPFSSLILCCLVVPCHSRDTRSPWLPLRVNIKLYFSSLVLSLSD